MIYLVKLLQKPLSKISNWEIKDIKFKIQKLPFQAKKTPTISIKNYFHIYA